MESVTAPEISVLLEFVWQLFFGEFEDVRSLKMEGGKLSFDQPKLR
jgi:hypothetical protein